MPIVYHGFDQKALDLQYDNRANVADPQRHLDWYTTSSERALARVAHVSDVAYGNSADERLDIFRPHDATSTDRRPVVVFVHGGAWRHLSRAVSGFAAETFTARGALYVALGFSRMPAAGSIYEMVAQVRTACAWLWQNIDKHGGDSRRICLLGHSSGAHLGAMALCTDWLRQYAIKANVLQRAALVSGIYDLEPVRLSYRNELLKLDRAAELRNSPCRNLPAVGVPLLVAYGEHDTSEFRRQAEEFHALWQARYGNAQSLQLAGLNHYETIEAIADPGSELSRAVIRLFSL